MHCCISLTSQKTRRLDGSAIFFEQKESHHVVTCLFFNKENPDVTNSIFLSFKNQILTCIATSSLMTGATGLNAITQYATV